MGAKTFVGTARLPNGFEITETASCVRPEDYNSAVGDEIVTERIRLKIAELLGFLLQCVNASTQEETT